MNKYVFTALGLVLFAAVTASALFYRNASVKYRAQWIDAVAELEAGAPAPARRDRLGANVSYTVTNAPDPDAALLAEVTTLRSRVRELEAQLEERPVAMTASTRPTPPGENDQPRPERRDPNQWLEDLRQTDPQRYEEIQARRAAMQQTIQENFARRAAYLLERDTSRLSEDEAKEHQLMVSLLTETWQMVDQIQQDGLSREERWELAGAMRQNVSTLVPLLDNERNRALRDLGQDMGYAPEEAQNFAEYVDEIYELTSPGPLFRSTGRGGRGGGPPRN
jgi:hypothetical protein